MEHRRPNGGWGRGYFCGHCGKETSMYGHFNMGNGKPSCEPNPELVKQCEAANPREGVKPRYVITATTGE